MQQAAALMDSSKLFAWRQSSQRRFVTVATPASCRCSGFIPAAVQMPLPRAMDCAAGVSS